VAFIPDGKTLAAGYGVSGDKGGVVLWDAAARTRRVEDPLPVREGVLGALAFSPDEKLLASGSDDKTVKIWERAEGDRENALGVFVEVIPQVLHKPSQGPSHLLGVGLLLVQLSRSPSRHTDNQGAYRLQKSAEASRGPFQRLIRPPSSAVRYGIEHQTLDLAGLRGGAGRFGYLKEGRPERAGGKALFLLRIERPHEAQKRIKRAKYR
jgi:hypothetical protein